jgi:hypothetical protein
MAADPLENGIDGVPICAKEKDAQPMLDGLEDDLGHDPGFAGSGQPLNEEKVGRVECGGDGIALAGAQSEIQCVRNGSGAGA